MIRTLFDLAGIAMLGWALLVFLPTWKVTRRVAESALFPLFVCMLYVVGIVTVLREIGPGFMRDFGSAEGVLGLLRVEGIALVAWIHILAFDHLVGILIYRDNMRHRFVPIPVQSILLVGTLMLGPVGFLAYWLARSMRRRSPLVAWGEADPPAAVGAREVPIGAPRFAAVATGSTVRERLVRLWRLHPALTGVGLLGFGFAAVTTGVAAWNGGWLLAPEGRLLEAVKFDVAVGIYTLTVALILPFARMTEPGRRRWVAWAVGLTLFAYFMENVQAWRGLDPRFSRVAGPVDQALGGLFFLQALGLLVLFGILMAGFFRRDALPDHAPLRAALRYATAAALIAFGVGVVMSGVAGRALGAGGDLMPIHAAGFHGLQAVPLVALLAAAGPLPASVALRLTHLAGIGWLLLCAGLVIQPMLGHPPGAPTAALFLAVGGVLAWAAALGFSLRVWWARERVPA